MCRKMIALIPLWTRCGFVLSMMGQPVPVLAQSAEYRSPYRVEFRYPLPELVGDLQQTERGNPHLEAEIPFHEWYSRRALERWGAWGPRARDFPAPRDVHEWPAERKRERVVAVAMRYLGYAYQHHHIPDWSPPRHWPWKETCAGVNGKGVDCSNLTGFVYNLGFGLRMSTEVHHQSEQHAALSHGGELPIHTIALPDSYEERLKVLRTGDLVYIRNNRGNISHVVIWVGPIGRSRDGTPLIIDSHGEGVRDSEGQTIPCGVQLRPFHKESWYNHSASHAHRLFVGP